jgi:G3E family GTPase
MDENIPDFTPVNLLTGFLGSGKTTLLQKLLADPALADCAVLINEFGEVGLDHHLLERIDENMVVLQSGCICCTIRGELSTAIRDLHSRRERGEIAPFRRLVIESTGLADPFPILSTIHADPVLKHHFRLGNVIATIDAVNAMEQLDRQEECRKQIAVADRLIMTKTDIAEPVEVRALLARIRRINPAAPLWRGAEEDVSVKVLLDQDDLRAALDPMELTAGNAGHAHNHTPHHHDGARHDDNIRAFALVFEHPLDWTMFGVWLTMLLNRHGVNILRVKGILNLIEIDAPVAVHGVQHLVHPPTHMRAWPDADRRSRIVFIVKDIAREDIERSLRAFDGLAAHAEAAVA